MKTSLLFLVVLFLGISSFGQLQDVTPPKTDVGQVGDGTYSNDCLGFSYHAPQGWDFTPDTQAQAVRIDAIRLGLFHVWHKHEDSRESINFYSVDDHAQAAETQRYIATGEQSYVNDRPQDREILADSHPLTISGRQFYRADLRSRSSANATLYVTFIATTFRGYHLAASITADTKEGLDAAVNALRGLSFRDDERNAQCMLSDQPRPQGGVVGITGGKIDPAEMQKMMKAISPKPDVQLTEAATQPMLLEKSPPQYPESARENGLQGEVVLDIVVGKDGTVIFENGIKGDPHLFEAALRTVRTWKYKPYVVDGKPLIFETQVTLNIQPPTK
ncbi:MAG TPA: energy transducer TonB [Candidatus Koribacter sp.]